MGISFTFRSMPGRTVAEVYLSLALADPVGWLLVLLNSLILYFPFGLRLIPEDT